MPPRIERRQVNTGLNRWSGVGEIDNPHGQARTRIAVDSTGELNGEYVVKRLKHVERRDRLKNEILETKRLFQLGAPVLEIVDDYIAKEPEAEHPWYVTRFLPRGSLRVALEDLPPGGPDGAWAWATAVELLGALQRIHGLGVAHRDLKPENILINDNDQLVLCDFGLCLPLHEDPGVVIGTNELEQVGSRHYMPPEAFGGKRVTPERQVAYDVYAFGKILYELLTGRVLPGFQDHRDPEYDVAARRGFDYSPVNAILDDLLNSDPERRLRAWPPLVDGLSRLRTTVLGRVQKVVPSRLPGRILFASNRRGRGYEVYSVYSDGSDLLNISGGSVDLPEGDPCWSPDGRRIVFYSYRRPRGEYSDRVHTLMILEDGLPRRFLEERAERPRWSPDGASVSFYSGQDSHLWLIDTQGRNRRLLTTLNSGPNHSWSPDGKRIAFTRDLQGTYQIWVVNSDGTDPHGLTDGRIAHSFPAWSPNGKEIACSQWKIGSPDCAISVLRSDGSDGRVVVDNPGAADRWPTWSP